MDGARKGLGTCEVIDLPLLILRGDHRHLGSSQEPHHVRDTVRDESSLATALDVRAVKSRPTDSTLLHQDERSPECFAGICGSRELGNRVHVPGLEDHALRFDKRCGNYCKSQIAERGDE